MINGKKYWYVAISVGFAILLVRTYTVEDILLIAPLTVCGVGLLIIVDAFGGK